MAGYALMMASAALVEWRSTRTGRLDQLTAAHAAVGGTARGRRFTTDQLNRAYLLAIAAQFQGYCRDLHTEAIDAVAGAVQPAPLAIIFRQGLTRRRNLDHGNPTPDKLAEDFARLGIAIWEQGASLDARIASRKQRLQRLMQWRNALAHDDPVRIKQHGALTLATAKGLRSACNGLATTLDRVVEDSLYQALGRAPW